MRIAKEIRRFANRVHCWYYRNRRRRFSCGGRDFRYFCHRRNDAWRSERTVEVPIAWDYVTRFHGKRILEVGNVLSHYFPIAHDVVDKYEKAAGVINEDIVDYAASPGYDLIVSISTLEHVGWDEEPKDPAKIFVALERLESLLNEDGVIVATVPLGHNHFMDEQFEHGKPYFDQMHCLKRISADNRWQQAPWPDVRGARYGTPFPFANAVIVGVLRRASRVADPQPEW